MQYTTNMLVCGHIFKIQNQRTIKIRTIKIQNQRTMECVNTKFAGRLSKFALGAVQEHVYVANILERLVTRPDVMTVEVNQHAEWRIEGGHTWYNIVEHTGLSSLDSSMPTPQNTDSLLFSDEETEENEER